MEVSGCLPGAPNVTALRGNDRALDEQEVLCGHTTGATVAPSDIKLTGWARPYIVCESDRWYITGRSANHSLLRGGQL